MQSHSDSPDASSPGRFSSSPDRFFDIHGVLLHVAKNDYNPHYHPLFEQRNYSLIFRKACCEQNLGLIELLLKYKDKIDLDINAQSSNGNTALDWVLGNSNSSGHKDKIVSILIIAGARSSDEQCEELSSTDEDSDDHAADASSDIEVPDESVSSDEEHEPQWPLSCNML